jgi:hypothetical protein
MVQAFDTPGNCSALSISAIRLSIVTPGRHSSFGLRLMIVSNISVGRRIGCVGASRLAEDRLDLGNDLMMRSCVCISSAALVTERPGRVVGMYISVPSLRSA